MVIGLFNLCNIYLLVNGDLLVIEFCKMVKEFIEWFKCLVMDLIEAWVYGGSGGGLSNWILLVCYVVDGGVVLVVLSVLVDYLNVLFGVVVVGDVFYVVDIDVILCFLFKVGDVVVGGLVVKVIDLLVGVINYYWIKSFMVNVDGLKFYVGVGFNSNVMECGFVVEMNCVVIWEVDLVSGVFKVFVSGLCNFNGLNFYLGSDVLWVVVNEWDEFGLNLVFDYMIFVKFGVFYGWFFSYWG